MYCFYYIIGGVHMKKFIIRTVAFLVGFYLLGAIINRTESEEDQLAGEFVYEIYQNNQRAQDSQNNDNNEEALIII